MDLQMRFDMADSYKSNSQKIRVITEDWVSKNLFCPCCGNSYINHFTNNRPVADFYCEKCSEEYELKSKNGAIANKVNDGAYDTMIERIQSINNPNFFFMHYNRESLKVKNFVVVPKHFFRPEYIEKRRPLSESAKRAGWTGCNILLNQIPDEGRIYIVKNEIEQPIDEVVKKIKKTDFIKSYKLNERGWILDILYCVNLIPERRFTLKQIYRFEDMLAQKHPNNHHVKDKIRQQLQLLRNKGIIEFKGNGVYQKV